MDELELLGRLGEVEPADQAVLDRALRALPESAWLDDRGPRSSTRTRRRRHQLIAVIISATALAAAVAIALVNSVAAAGPARRSERLAGAHSGSRAPTMRAILTALDAHRTDILEVTKTMRGDYGTVGKTVMWLSPAEPAPGMAVRARILQFSLSGARQSDTAITYTAGVPTARPAPAACGMVFHRPSAAFHAASGPAGTLTFIDYAERFWARAAVRVRPGTVPSTSTLRACMRARLWHISGHGRLDGTRVTELVMAPGFEHLWVSTATLLPVRLVSAGPGADTITFSFSFLAPSAANKAALGPVIPAGFAKQRL